METQKKSNDLHPILLFDGVCNLCNGAVQFVIRNDKKQKFRFAALQSEAGKALMQEYGLPPDVLDTFVVLKNGKSNTRSTAALEVARTLGGLWALAYFFIIIPKFIRDGLYNWIAQNRYKWFGKQESCMIPTPELRSRFL